MLPLILLALATAVPPEPPVCPGNLYSVKLQEGWRVAKVLAVRPPIVVLRFYRNTFDARPTKVDPAKLVVGRVSDPEGFGTPAIVVDERKFLDEVDPQFLTRQPVDDTEVERAEEQLGVNGLKDVRDPGSRAEACRAPDKEPGTP